jgi:hypothetical protein
VAHSPLTSCTVLVWGGWYGGNGALGHAASLLPVSGEPAGLANAVPSSTALSAKGGERAAKARMASPRVEPPRPDDCGDGCSSSTRRSGRVSGDVELCCMLAASVASACSGVENCCWPTVGVSGLDGFSVLAASQSSSALDSESHCEPSEWNLSCPFELLPLHTVGGQFRSAARRVAHRPQAHPSGGPESTQASAPSS